MLVTVSLEGLVSQDHLLRKIDCAVDFTHIYDFVEDLYCTDNGRPSVDPVILFMMVLVQPLYGIPSLRRTVEEINMNIAYRWFLGYLLNEPVPHFATISYNFRHRFSGDTIEKVFTWILFEAQKSGYLSPEVVLIDGTHIKADANINKKKKKAIPSTAKVYEEQFMKEINEAHTVCDKHNFILDTVVTSGNVHDSVAFDALYERVTRRFLQIRIVTMDAGYKTPWICKRIIDDGRIPSLLYKR